MTENRASFLSEEEKWEKRLNRERALRKEAERILEEKSSELYAMRLSLEENLRELQLRNEKLTEFANYNSHHTRAPIARLLLLMQVIKTDEVDQEQALLLKNVKESAEELDSVVRKMNDILTQVDFYEDRNGH